MIFGTLYLYQGPPPPSSTAPVALQGGTAKGLDGAHWEAPTHSKRSSVPKARTVTHDCGDPGLVRHTDIPQIPTSRSQVPLTRFRDLPAFHQDTDPTGQARITANFDTVKTSSPLTVTHLVLSGVFLRT